MRIMFCPNCGHKVDPDQKFCDNCGWALKNKKTEDSSNVKDDDKIRSLSEIENELNEEEPTSQTKAPLQQAPAQKREYGSFDHPTSTPSTNESKSSFTPRADPEEAMKTYTSSNHSNNSSFSQSKPEEPLDDKTQIYSKNDFNPISQKPYKKAERTENTTPHKSFEDPIKEPMGNPFEPTESEKRAAEAKREAQETDPNDGFLHNMLKFAKNNAYISILAVIVTAILLVVKRNYGFIALAIVIILWFLLSQLGHGNETGANKALKHETSLKKNNTDDQTQAPRSENEPTISKHQQRKIDKKAAAAERIVSHKKTTSQKIIIAASIIGFIATIGGPFLNSVSLSSTIATAANYTANLGAAQPTWITNGFSAIRLICFLSPVIALIAACFRSRGSIRLVRIFTMLPTILYAALYAALYAGIVNSTAITGQVAVTTNGSFGTSFYVLLITSIVSLIMSYTLRPVVK